MTRAEAKLHVQVDRLRRALIDVLPLCRAPHDAAELGRLRAAADLLEGVEPVDGETAHVLALLREGVHHGDAVHHADAAGRVLARIQGRP